VAFLLHNAEEALTIPAMLPRAQAIFASVLGPGATLPSARQYYIALMAITVAAFVLWRMALWWDSLSYLLVVLQATMALNVVSHLGAAVALRGYAPGLVTAVLVEGVVSVVVYRRLKRAGWMSRLQWMLTPLLALVLHGPVALGLLVLVMGV
jgi:hypothetical protein